MTTIYECDVCGKSFYSSLLCRKHEVTHYEGVDKIKYKLTHFYNKDVCDYCDCSYYVYGVERNCKHKDCKCNNNYKDFVPTEPLHDKSISGV